MIVEVVCNEYGTSNCGPAEAGGPAAGAAFAAPWIWVGGTAFTFPFT